MTFAQECTIAVEPERLWDLLMDVPAVARCVPGVEGVEPIDAKAYQGNLRVQIGPIRLSLHGTMTVDEQDRAAWRARMRAEANDRRVGGGIRARMSLALAPENGATRLRIDTDLTILGRIGEFGQPVIRKKADAMLAQFAQNLAAKLQQGG